MKNFKARIAIVDDDKEMRALLEDYLIENEYDVICFNSAIDAIQSLTPDSSHASNQMDSTVDLVISDINMPEMTGLDFTVKLKQLRPEIPVILITAFGSVETAVEAMQRGAFHYVLKPFKLTEMLVHVERAIQYRQLQQDNTVLRQELKGNWSLGNIIGKSASIKIVFDLINRVSKVTSNVLITGESGTGKEMVAQAIHSTGPRASKPFVAINCTAIPENLLESELFGHAKGSFTGATQRKRGLFEEANGGTIFLDEIGDMDVALQSKLLRVIQEKKVRAVGENISRDIDVRIISATHKDLKTAMKEGRFREDLYYRLSVIPVMIPPLRQRVDDIPLLAEHFLRKHAAANGVNVKGFTKRVISKLMEMRWEGNVRELENVVERAVVLCTGNLVDEMDLPTVEDKTTDKFFSTATTDFPTITQLEERYIRLILEKTGGRKDKASQILGINRRTLYRKEQEYGLASPGETEDFHVEQLSESSIT